jgi:hypothetical protein
MKKPLVQLQLHVAIETNQKLSNNRSSSLPLFIVWVLARIFSIRRAFSCIPWIIHVWDADANTLSNGDGRCRCLSKLYWWIFSNISKISINMFVEISASYILGENIRRHIHVGDPLHRYEALLFEFTKKIILVARWLVRPSAVDLLTISAALLLSTLITIGLQERAYSSPLPAQRLPPSPQT